jgi:polygalacturonase
MSTMTRGTQPFLWLWIIGWAMALGPMAGADDGLRKSNPALPASSQANPQPLAHPSTLALPVVQPAPVPARNFNIANFGAIGDGKTMNTQAIGKAIEACGKAGGGSVIVPAGKFITGPFELVSNMALILQKGAVLRASGKFDDFKLSDAQAQAQALAQADEPAIDQKDTLVNPLITGRKLINVTIKGEGTIDGFGQPWWARARAESAAGAPAQGDHRKSDVKSSPRPHLIYLRDCSDIHVSGVALKDSPNFHLLLRHCQNVLVEDMSITAPARSPNTDGIDPVSCSNIVIRRCTIDVGDDNVALTSRPGGTPTCNALVTDCDFRHGHGVSIGSYTAGGVHDISVVRCKFDGTMTALRIKSARDRGGLVENIRYQDLNIKNVGEVFLINLFYYDNSKVDAAQKVTPTTPIVRHVQFINIDAIDAQHAGEIIGLPEMPISDVSLDNVHIAAKTGVRILHARHVTFTRSQVNVSSGDAVISTDADVKGIDRSNGSEGHH